MTSTRAHFEDFKLRHRKDARFRNFGRDDRDREREFKSWLRELGEKKRAEAKRLEVKFEELLSETVGQDDVARGVAWTEVRERIKSDRRFEDVKSSSLKEEIFDRWIKKRREALGDGEAGEDRKNEERRQRQEASLRAREEQVRRQRDQLERDAGRSLRDLGREEAEREFRNLLVDAVRDHDVRPHSLLTFA